MTRARRMVLLLVLTLGHFLVDMLGGFLLPLLPSLADRLDSTDAMMGVVASIAGVAVNTIQPLAGFVIHRFRAPLFLWLGPILAIGYALLGEVHSVPQLIALVVLSSIGVGLFHPSALLGAHVVSGIQDRVGIPVFLSGGAFGVAVGAIVASQWVDRLGYEQFWWLALPAALLALLMLPTGVLRLDIHQPLPPQAQQDGLRLPFGVLMLLGGLLATDVTLLVTYFPMHLKTVLGGEALVWGGLSLSIISIGGAVSSYLWGAVSRRVHILRVLGFGQLATTVALLLLLSAGSTTGVLYASIITGFCAGGAFFPLIATLARHATGLTPGLRAGLIIGGSWGIGSLGAVLGAGLLKLDFSSTQVCLLTVPIAILTGVIALIVDRRYVPVNSTKGELASSVD